MNGRVGGKAPDRKKIEIRTCCPECGYRHQRGRTAGFFVLRGFNGGRYDDDDDESGILSEDGEESTLSGAKERADEDAEVEDNDNDEDEDEERLHRRMTPAELAADAELRLDFGPAARRLNTPNFIRSIGYVRCNCITGVPNDVLGWLPVKHPRFVGGIKLDPKDLDDFEPARRAEADDPPPPLEAVALALPFLDGRSIGRACGVCHEWNAAGRTLPRFVDLSRMAVCAEATFRAHDDGAVEAIVPYGRDDGRGGRGWMFTAGDRSVKLWRGHGGASVSSSSSERDRRDDDKGECADGCIHYEQVSSPVEDTAMITSLMLLPYYGPDGGVLFTGSSNGYVRRWTVHQSPSPHLALSAASSNHERRVNGMVSEPPAWGSYCTRHGLWEHTCRFFTCSDDRTVRVWDSVTGEESVGDRIETPSRRCCTVQSLEVSDRHLFAGTSGGSILVYPLDRVCDRDDTHLCTETPDEPRKNCLQAELRHGEEMVQVLKVGGPHFSMEYLFSGSRDGTVAVFRLPPAGSLDFRHVGVLRGHKLGVISMAMTWSHLYTGADDGLRMWDLSYITYPFCFQRSLDVMYPGAVRCLCIDEGQRWCSEDGFYTSSSSDGQRGESHLSARYLYVGLASGEVQTWRLGEWV